MFTRFTKRFFQQKVGVAQIKKGDTILHNKKFMIVNSNACTGSARGTRQYNLVLKDHSGPTVSNLKPTLATIFEKFTIKDVPMQYLYYSEDVDCANGGLLTFMHQETMEQMTVKSSLISSKFLSIIESGHEVKIRCAIVTANEEDQNSSSFSLDSPIVSVDGTMLIPLIVLGNLGSYRCRVKEILGVREASGDGRSSYNILLDGGHRMDCHIRVKEGDHVLVNADTATFVGRCLEGNNNNNK